MREAMVRRFGADKVVHIPNGIDASRIEMSETGRRLRAVSRAPVVRKGVETLLRAHAASGARWRLDDRRDGTAAGGSSAQVSRRRNSRGISTGIELSKRDKGRR